MRSLTTDELIVMNLLGQAMIKFSQLKQAHIADDPEFGQAIHAAQNIVLARPATETIAEKSHDNWSGLGVKT